MKEFLIGFIFLVVVFVLAGIGVLLMPLFVVLTLLLRVIIIILLLVFAIWLLGKTIVTVWEKIKEK